MPRRRKVPGHAYRLLQLSHQGLQWHDQPAAREGGNSDHVLDLPHNGSLAARYLRPQQDHFPADWRSRQRALHELPPQRQFHLNSYRLLLVPYQGLQRDDKSKSRTSGNSNELRDVSHHNGVATRQLRPQQDRLSPDRRPRQRALLQLPSQWKLHNGSDRLLLMPYQGLQRHNQSEPCSERHSHNVRRVSQHDGLATGNLRSQQDSIPINGSSR